MGWLAALLILAGVPARADDAYDLSADGAAAQQLAVAVGAGLQESLESMGEGERHAAIARCMGKATRLAGGDGLFKPNTEWFECFAEGQPALTAVLPKMRELERRLRDCSQAGGGCTVRLKVGPQAFLYLDDGQSTNVGWSEAALARIVPPPEEVVVHGQRPARPRSPPAKPLQAVASPGIPRSAELHVFLQTCEAEQTRSAISLLQLLDLPKPCRTKDGWVFEPLQDAVVARIRVALAAAGQTTLDQAALTHQNLYVELLRMHALEKLVRARARLGGSASLPRKCTGAWSGTDLGPQIRETYLRARESQKDFDAAEARALIAAARAGRELAERAAQLTDHPNQVVCTSPLPVETSCHVVDHSDELPAVSETLTVLARGYPLLFATPTPARPLWEGRGLLAEFADFQGDPDDPAARARFAAGPVAHARAAMGAGVDGAIAALCEGDLPDGVTETDLAQMGIPEDFLEEHPRLREAFGGLQECLLSKVEEKKRRDYQDRVAPYIAMSALLLFSPLGEGAGLAFAAADTAIAVGANVDSAKAVRDAKTSYGLTRACLQSGDSLCASADLAGAVDRLNAAVASHEDAKLAVFLSAAGAAVTGARTAVRAVRAGVGDAKALTETVAINWIPDNMHSELQVDGKVWNLVGGYERGREATAFERVMRSAKRGFVRFELRVTPEELERMKDYLELNKGTKAAQTCIGGVCNVIDRTTGILIPTPFSKGPALSALYLTLTRSLGYTRIGEITVFGRIGGTATGGAILHEAGLASLLAAPLAASAGLTARATYLLSIPVVDRFGKATQLIVPLESSSEVAPQPSPL
jgi:hypothetical protein